MKLAGRTVMMAILGLLALAGPAAAGPPIDLGVLDEDDFVRTNPVGEQFTFDFETSGLINVPRSVGAEGFPQSEVRDIWRELGRRMDDIFITHRESDIDLNYDLAYNYDLSFQICVNDRDEPTETFSCGTYDFTITVGPNQQPSDHVLPQAESRGWLDDFEEFHQRMTGGGGNPNPNQPNPNPGPGAGNPPIHNGGCPADHRIH